MEQTTQVKGQPMQINADFSKRVLVRFADTDWVASPAAGVERKMLDRIGDEVARATTIVRFAPGSAFSEHTHDGGEEYLVLDGVFQDEHGDFPTGTYVRNPPTTHHAPAAANGAMILVKLHQFDPDDRTEVTIDTTANADSAPIQPLFRDAQEQVRIETWPPGASVQIDARGGLEAFVLDGGFTEDQDALTQWDWLRLPPDAVFHATAGPNGARVWLKSGHLAQMIVTA
jgi:quercetin dioxygenase-like cupin family protein